MQTRRREAERASFARSGISCMVDRQLYLLEFENSITQISDVVIKIIPILEVECDCTLLVNTTSVFVCGVCSCVEQQGSTWFHERRSRGRASRTGIYSAQGGQASTN